MEERAEEDEEEEEEEEAEGLKRRCKSWRTPPPTGGEGGEGGEGRGEGFFWTPLSPVSSAGDNSFE